MKKEKALDGQLEGGSCFTGLTDCLLVVLLILTLP